MCARPPSLGRRGISRAPARWLIVRALVYWLCTHVDLAMPEGEGTPPGSGELVSRARIRVSGHLGGAMAEAVDSRSECCLSRPAKSTIPCGVVGPTVSSMSHSTMLRWRSLLGVQPPYPTTRLSMLRRTVTRRKSSSSALKNASIHMPFSRSFGGVSCSGPTNDSSNSEPSRDWVVPDSDLALRTESQICRLSTSRS